MVEGLESKYEVYDELNKENRKLIGQLENKISQEIDKAKDLIKWYRQKGLMFTHPTINYRSGRGPILGYDSSEEKLYVYSPKNGVLEIELLYERKEKNILIRDLIVNGHFETAIDGLRYLDVMIDSYISDLEEVNSKLEQKLEG